MAPSFYSVHKLKAICSKGYIHGLTHTNGGGVGERKVNIINISLTQASTDLTIKVQ